MEIKEILYRLLSNGVTQFHVAEESMNMLEKMGYRELDVTASWKVSPGGRYYVRPFSSMLVAFAAGGEPERGRLNIGLAHTDFPMLKIKTRPDMDKSGYRTLNVEPYGGLIKETWFDRPLGIAGKVVLDSGSPFAPDVRLYDSHRAVCVIPSLAPHLRRGDTQEKMNVQKELIPVYAMAGKGSDTGLAAGHNQTADTDESQVRENDIPESIADELGVGRGDILDYDLYLYNMEKPEVIGIIGEFLSSPRIDNVSSVAALVAAMEECGENGINVIALFDNEEIGSRSKQGADSTLLAELIKRFMSSLGLPEEVCYKLYHDAFMLSLDVAHATHPNYPEKSDPTNPIVLGGGVTLKSSASQRYVSDSEAAAVIVALARKHDIRIQRQVNRSGMQGGQTLGPIASSYLPVRAVDMGMPVLAMHSARELGSVRDYEELVHLCKAVFKG